MMRRILKWIGVLLGLLVIGAAATVLYLKPRSIDTTGKVPFDHRLRIPPLDMGEIDAEGRRVFDLDMRRGSTDFGRRRSTPTLGFNGDYLGPTLRARRGEEVLIRVHNHTGQSTTVHWHGMHLPARMDGGPHQKIADGETFSPTWTIDQPSATLWYHPHLQGRTLEQVYRGMAGLFILDDDDPAQLALPHEYGIDDIPVIVRDRKFAHDGKFDLKKPFWNRTGVIGDVLLVNGTVGAYQPVTTTRVRLRLLNGSNGRVYNFGFNDHRHFVMVASDGGLLARPARLSRLRLTPGERAEIVVTMKPSERAVLRSYPTPGMSTGDGGNDTLDLLELRAARSLDESNRIPDSLANVVRLEPSRASTTRTFTLADHEINHAEMSMSRIDTVVTLGDTEIWNVRNDDREGATHSFHIHDVQFQVLRYDGKPPPPELAGWKDTVAVPPGRDGVRLIMRFTDYADPHWPYMYHCHVLYHEDQGMMGQFVVVKPGEQVAGGPGVHRRASGEGRS